MANHDYIRRWSRARNYALSELAAERPDEWEECKSLTACRRDAVAAFRGMFPDVYAELLAIGKRREGI